MPAERETSLDKAVGAYDPRAPIGGDGIGYLERHYDSGIRLPRNLDRSMLTNQEIERIVRSLTMMRVISEIPRRLGEDASAPELALDKRRARRVGWAFQQSLLNWRKKIPRLTADDDLRSQASLLVWEAFVPAHSTELRGRMALIATWSIRMEDTRWGRSAIVRLENEAKWVLYALRD